MLYRVAFGRDELYFTVCRNLLKSSRCNILVLKRSFLKRDTQQPEEEMVSDRRFYLLSSYFLLAVSLHSASAQDIPTLFDPPLSPRIANYNINVKLDTETRQLHGNQVLIWHNQSTDTITELQFHLYLNAFRNSESTFIKESGGQLRGIFIEKGGWGFSDVKKIAVVYGSDLQNSIQYLHPSDAPEVLPHAIDLTEQMQFIQPDDGNIHDKTVFRIPLPKPLPPGEFVAVQMDFEAQLPTPPFARTGAKEEYFMVGQWFPKVGVYIDGEWNCHQFHGHSEFFADFGVYNVRMTVPAENVVGATGVEVSVTKNEDGTATHFYHAEDVHDFAWTSSPEFVEFKGNAHDVDFRVLMQPDHLGQGPRHLKAAVLAVEYFQHWYGDYPFPNLTIVDPRRGAMGSGGMEYPTLITAGTHYGMPDGIRLPESAIIHEFAHNYWYGMLASNEFEESWMDEGMTSFGEAEIMNDAYGPQGDFVDLFGIELSMEEGRRSPYLTLHDRDMVIRRAWEFYSRGSYGVNSYSKPALILATLRNYLGEEMFGEIMRTYFERWKFKHPKSQDFFDIVNEVAGQDMNWFIEQAFYSNAHIDYAVAYVTTREMKSSRGIDFDKNAEEDTTAGDVETDSSSNNSTPTLYESAVSVRRLGDFKMPVEIEIAFANGDTLRENWDGQDLWKKYRYVKPARLVSATVDPENKIRLDINFTNNSKTVKKQNLGVNKLSARMLFWTQFLLDQPEIMNAFTFLNSIF
jgi:hypothetical protein